MKFLDSKDNIIEILHDPEFLRLVDLNEQPKKFVERPMAMEFSYYNDSTSDAEPKVILGHTLLWSPTFHENESGRECNHIVAKLYGSPDLPFRVELVVPYQWESSLWEDRIQMRDFKTFSQAFEYAFASIEIQSTNTHAIDSHIDGKLQLNPTREDPVSRALDLFEDKRAAAMQAQLDKAARLSAPFKANEVKAVMRIAKSQGLRLDEFHNLDYANQVNELVFASKGRVFELSHQTIIEEMGGSGEIGLVGFEDAFGETQYFDVEGIPKSETQVRQEYREHLKNTFFNGSSTARFNLDDITLKRIDGDELATKIAYERHLRGDPELGASRYIGYATLAVKWQRESQFQRSLASREPDGPGR
jgi:hypothetical protein